MSSYLALSLSLPTETDYWCSMYVRAYQQGEKISVWHRRTDRPTDTCTCVHACTSLTLPMAAEAAAAAAVACSFPFLLLLLLLLPLAKKVDFSPL